MFSLYCTLHHVGVVPKHLSAGFVTVVVTHTSISSQGAKGELCVTRTCDGAKELISLDHQQNPDPSFLNT